MPRGRFSALPLKMTSSIEPPRRCFGALLAEHPADGVDDVRLAAAVRTDDAGDARGQLEHGAFHERLEPVQLDLLDAH
jgi:hypothetical protein